MEMAVPIALDVAGVGFDLPAYEFRDLIARSKVLIRASHDIQKESKNLRADALLARKRSRLLTDRNLVRRAR